MLGIDGPYLFNWTAPHSHFVQSSAANDGYPLQEPGSFSLVNASTPQLLTLDNIFGEDVPLCLDPLVSCSSKSAQLNSAKFGIELNTYI